MLLCVNYTTVGGSSRCCWCKLHDCPEDHLAAVVCKLHDCPEDHLAAVVCKLHDF